MDNCEDLPAFLNTYAKLAFERDGSERLKIIFSHKRIRSKNSDGWSLADKFHMSFCTTSENATVLNELGVDARNLIGTGVIPFYTEKFLKESGWELFRIGWMVVDFRKLDIFVPFYRFNYAFRYSLQPFHGVERRVFSRIDTKSLLGDPSSCAICKSAFDRDDEILLLQCKHVFHSFCATNFIKTNIYCLYCSKLAFLSDL